MAAESAPLLDQIDNDNQFENDNESNASETSSLMGRDVERGMLARKILAIMGFLGFANVYAMRVNLSVAIVAMVNNTAIASNSSIIDNSTCPVAANSTEGPPPDGPFAWGAKEQGWILGAFFFGYVVTQLPGGRLAEKYGGKRLYGGGILITSIFTLLTPLAATISLPLFVIVRVVEGFGEGVTFPVMHALLAQWIPPNERSRMAGIVYSGAQAGTVLSLPISGLLCDAFGWPSVFYVFGFLGLIWWIGWCYLVYDSPQVHPRISSAERRYILDSLASSKTSSTTLPVPWLKVFTSGPVWALVLVHVAQNYGFYTLLTELPTYMHNVLHFNMKSNAMLSALPYLAMLLVSLFATRLADYAITSGFDRTLVRKFFNSVGVYLPAVFIAAAGYSGCDSFLVIVFLVLAVGVNGAQYAGFMCVHLDMASNFAGTLLGITNCAANMMGVVAPAVAGYLTQDHSDAPHWRVVFFVAALVYIVGNTIFLVWGSAKEQSWNRGSGADGGLGVEEDNEDDPYSGLDD